MVIYKADTNHTTKVINAMVLHGETALIINSEQELFHQFDQGIDVLCLPSEFHAIASLLSNINLCMQIIYFPSHTSLLPLHARNKNSFIFADIDKAIARSIQLKKKFYYLDNDQEFIRKDSIIYVHKEKQKLKSSFHMCNSDVICINIKFTDVIPYFVRPKFIIVHPHYIVQLSKIIAISTNTLTLTNGEKLPIADSLRISILRDYIGNLC